MNESVRFGLARLISERLCSDYGVAINDLDGLEATLAEKANLDEAKARALVWGERLQLTLPETDLLAEALSFHEDLLACIIHPTSKEILSHVLHNIALSDLDPSCEDCADMRDWIQDIEILDSASVGQLCLDILGHIIIGVEPKMPVDPMPGEEALLQAFRGLNPEAQARVISYAYAERGNSVGSSLPKTSEIYSRMRQDYLSPLVREVLDLLSQSPKGAMSAQELALGLDRSDARSIGQVARSLQKSLSEMRQDGYLLDEPPLVVRRSSRGSIYKLSDSAKKCWCAILESQLPLETE